MNINIKANNQLYESVYRVLIDEMLISAGDNVRIENIYPTKRNGKIIYHHIITSEKDNKKYLLRTIKEKDYSYLMTRYLINLNSLSGYNRFSCALTPPFSINNNSYIITSFIDGVDLETLINKLDDNELQEISMKLENSLNLLHNVTNDKYSNFPDSDCCSFADIMFNKIKTQSNNKYNIFLKKVNKNKLLNSIYEILLESSFTKPTLLHMDITPKNIIYSEDRKICLIDFELSRFGDLDYEWTNILIKLLCTDNEKYKQYILMPIINNNFMPMHKALHINKCKVYLLYLAINKYIYSTLCDLECPQQIIELASYLVDHLADSAS